MKMYLDFGSISSATPHNGEVRRYHTLGSHHIIQAQCASRMSDASSEDKNLLGICKARLGDMAVLGRYLELLF
jgi:hypothetical protein